MLAIAAGSGGGNKTCEPTAVTQNRLPGAPAVGSHSPQGDSRVGVADMTGNVWQYTSEVADIHSRGVLLRGGSNYRPGIDGVAGSHWYFRETDDVAQAAAGPLTLHNKYMLMSDSYERAGTVSFRCVVEAMSSVEAA